jgi:hypothetical protein
VTIRINDPYRLMGPANRVTSTLATGVRDQWENFHPAHQTASDGAGHTLQVDVPYGVPLNLWIQSWRFLLAGPNSAPINNWGTRIPFQVVAGAAAPDFTFTITGEVARPAP